MSFLTINGTNYNVLTEGASEEEPSFGGLTIEHAYDGTTRGQYVPPARKWSFDLEPMPDATYSTLRGVVAAGTVTVNGDCVGNVATTAYVRINSAQYLADGLAFLRLVSIEITQVV